MAAQWYEYFQTSSSLDCKVRIYMLRVFKKSRFNIIDSLIDFNIKNSISNIFFQNVRLWWIIAFGLLLTACGTQIHKLWKKWGKNPVTMELSNRMAPISTLPFPTVTICTKTKTSKDKLDLHFIYQNIETSQLNMDNLTKLE